MASLPVVLVDDKAGDDGEVGIGSGGGGGGGESGGGGGGGGGGSGAAADGGGGGTSSSAGGGSGTGSEGAAAGGRHLTLEGKLIMVGDSNSGKTSIIAAATRGELNSNTRPSIGVAFSKKSVTVPGATVNFQVWDTAGQEKFRSINMLYYRGAAAAVVVFDLTSAPSFDHCRLWLDEIRGAGSRNMIIALAGNKADLKSAQAVTSAAARAFADANGMLYFETSAKTGAGIAEVFKAIGACRRHEVVSCMQLTFHAPTCTLGCSHHRPTTDCSTTRTQHTTR